MGAKNPPGGGLWRVELGGGVSARLRKSGEGLCKVKLSDAGVKNLPANIEQQNGAVSLAFFDEVFQEAWSLRLDLIHGGWSSAGGISVTEPPPCSSLRSALMEMSVEAS